MFTLAPDTMKAAVPLLQPFNKLRRLDGGPIPATLMVVDGNVWLRIVPDLPRVTCVTAFLGPADGEGSVTAAADRLIEMCRRAHEAVKFECEQGVVHAGPWQTPAVPEVSLPADGEVQATVSRKGFLDGLESVKGAASTDLVRPRLTIVRFAKGFARACDGMRYREERVPFEDVWDVSVFLAPMLARYFGAIDAADLVLAQSDSHQSYTSAGIQVVAPRPVAEYMDLDGLVAQPAREHNNFYLKTDRHALMEAVRDVAIMSGEHGVITLDVAGSTLVVSAHDGGENRARVELACDWGGDERQLRFYCEPLLQLLRSSNRDRVELRLGVSTLRKLTSVVIWEDGRFALLNQVRMDG